MVEQEAVNFEVTGSSPVVGAIKNPLAFASGFFITPPPGPEPVTRQIHLAVVTGSAKRAKQKKARSIFFCVRKEETSKARRCPVVGPPSINERKG